MKLSHTLYTVGDQIISGQKSFFQTFRLEFFFQQIIGPRFPKYFYIERVYKRDNNKKIKAIHYKKKI